MTKTTITVHCSDTRPDWMSDKSGADRVAEIRRWHVGDNGWRDIGYNHIIDRDGTIYNGRDVDDDGDSFEEVGAHAKGHNSASVGVCLIGGHGSAATDAFSDHFTEAQNKALRAYMLDAMDYYPTIKKVQGHNEISAKACPGFHVPTWVKRKPARTNSTKDFVTGSKDVKVLGGTALVGTLAQYSGQAKAIIGDVEQMTGLDPIILLVAAAGAWWLYSRYTKHKRGVV